MAQEFTFTVNGVERTTTQNKPLLRYLRDDLHIHSAKDGCSEGACGTCTIHVDGAAVKACVLTTALAAGRNIVTVEGLPEDVREAFVYAFGAVGAVQCGFCIPGMVMAGAALIAEDPEPSEEQIKYAIRGNVCRCTGYKKIIEGISLAAAVLRGEKQIDEDLERGDDYGVGKRAFRIDVRKKVLGEGKYPDDIDELDQPGLTYASAVRSKYPRARVLSIDTSKAEALPGVVGILRAESLAFHPKRHAMDGTFTLGCDAEGNFTGLDCEINFDTGAYASLCGPVLERACTHAVGPYKYQNTDIRGFGYYTNNPPAGAYRGFGVCQSEFALESLIDLLAQKVGLDPWEIRYRNAIEPGEVLPNGQIADCSTALKETLLEVKDAYYAHPGHAGIACAMKNAGVGVGLPDAGRCKIRIEDGRAVVYAATSDIGQGCNTVFLQDVAEACGLPLRCIANGECSTENAPDSGTTSGSRQTVVTGEAVRGAAFLLRDAMLGIEAGKPAPDTPVNAHGDGVKIEYDDGRAYQLRAQELVAGQGMHPQDPAVAIKALEGCEFGYVYLEPTDKLGADVPNPKSHICYGFATHVVILDNDGRVSEVYAAHDSGKVVNPISIQGQIEGGVLMGMGYALTEDWPLKDCVPQARYGTLGLFRAPGIPDIHAIYVEKDELLPVAYGGKGIGEIATIPTAPAVQNAYRAFDGKLRPDLPMVDTPYSRVRNRG